MYGQVSTGQEQEFDYGIKNNSTQTVTSSVNLVTQGADGTYGKIALNINTKGFLSTGLIKNGLISANGDPTKFNITAGIGIISNFDDPENPISTLINFPDFTGITPTYLLTGTITYVAINSTPAVVMQATPFTPEQRRSLIVLGAVIHSNLTTINVINNISAPTNASTNQLHDFIEAVGALNLTGNKYTANGANLQLNKSAGLIFKLGSNFANDWKNPHELAQTAGTSLTFRYRTQNGTEGSDRINLDPALYDLNNVLTAVPNNKFTIQTVTMFQSGVTRIQYGQNVYDDLATAKNSVFTRNFVLEPNSKNNGIIRAYIIMKNTTTSLQNVADADILEAQKFGGVASGGIALTLANIVTALGYTPENVANKATDFTTVNNTLYPSVQAVNTKIISSKNYVSVKDYGAVGDGVADDTAAINSALAINNSLFFPKGTYLISSSIDVTGKEIIGIGKESVIKSTSAQFDMLIAPGGGCRIEDLEINGSWDALTAGQLGSGFVGGNVSGSFSGYIIIKNVRFQYCKENSIVLRRLGYSYVSNVKSNVSGLNGIVLDANSGSDSITTVSVGDSSTFSDCPNGYAVVIKNGTQISLNTITAEHTKGFKIEGNDNKNISITNCHQEVTNGGKFITTTGSAGTSLLIMNNYADPTSIDYNSNWSYVTIKNNATIVMPSGAFNWGEIQTGLRETTFQKLLSESLLNESFSDSRISVKHTTTSGSRSAGFDIYGDEGSGTIKTFEAVTQSNSGVNRLYSIPTSMALTLGTSNLERMRITPGGNFLFRTTTDNGEILQVNGNVTANTFKGSSAEITGTVTASPATVSTELVTKGQLDAVARPYKIYTALLTQTGTTAPVATVLENTLGGTVVWSYSDTGVYVATLSGAFTSSKTAIQLQNTSNTGVVSTFTGTSNFVSIATYDSIGASANGKLTEAFFEIRVYN
jgi:hypothetical protein